MLTNIFKIILRNIFRQKMYSAINILGLSTGITCFVMLFLYIQFEYSFDDFYPDSDQVYRVYQQKENNDFNGSEFFAVTPAQVAMVLENNFPEVLSATSFKSTKVYLGREGENLYLQKGLLASDHFFDVLKPDFIIGDSKEFVDKPFSIVITTSLRDKLFGNQNPIGMALSIWGKPCEIVGVINDFPENSTLEVSFIANLEILDRYIRELEQESWKNSSYHTFFKVAPGTDHKKLEAELQKVADEHLRNTGNDPIHYFVQPLSALHLNSAVNWDPGIRGNADQIRLFAIVGVLIFVLACINYVNLALARSIHRVKEVGLRKVIGADRTQLLIQFLAESFVFSFIALLVSILCLFYLLPEFGQYVDRPLSLGLIIQSEAIWLVVGVLLLTSLLSGFYPAYYLSAMRPVQAIKGKIVSRNSSISFQKILIGSQYVVSSGMVLCCLVIFKQLQFVTERDTGINRENVVTVELNGDDTEHVPAIKKEWNQLPQVKGITLTASLPIDVGGTNLLKDQNGEEHLVYRLGMDDQSKDVFGMQLLAGRFLSASFTTDRKEAILLNERAVAEFGWDIDEAVGQVVIGTEKFRVIGVVKDFTVQSMQLPIAPLYIHWANSYNYLSVSVESADASYMIGALHDGMKKYSKYPLDFTYLDDVFLKMYASEINEGKILGIFTIVAILIAVIGLFGMAALSAQKRAKEIGTRRAMGASVLALVNLLNRQFLGLVIIGSLLSIPLAFTYLSGWLAEYAYHISITWWMVVVPSIATILIVGLTISYQSWKIANKSPIESLRDE